MGKAGKDSAILREIREVIKDCNKGFKIRNYRERGPGDPATNKLEDHLAFLIIEDIIEGRASALTLDYRQTRQERRRIAKRTNTPAP